MSVQIALASHDQLLEPTHILNADIASRYFHKTLVTQVRDAPADGFEQQKSGQAFVRVHIAWHHQPVLEWLATQ
jgi:hypothetical protein